MNQPSPMAVTPGTTPGGTPSGFTPNGATQPKARKPQKPVDPFMRRKPQVRRRDPSPDERVRRGKPVHEKGEFFRVRDGATSSALVSVNAAIPIVDSSSGILTSGFTTAAPGNYKDYPVIITKRQLQEKLRFHAARFMAKHDVDPSNESEWTRPVRLHRRDSRAPLPGQKQVEPDAKDVQLEEEKEKLQQQRDQRQAQRAAEMAEIAPSLTGAQPKKFGKDQKKFVEVRRKDDTEAKRAASQLSYEEALPWHFEDDENKQIWVGTYEAALSETYAQFCFRGDKVHLAPMEKWYKFTQQRTFKSQEELEAFEAKRNTKDPRFLREWAEKQEVIKTENRNRQIGSKLWQIGGDRTANFKTGAAIKVDREDADELDFDEDIADDEEDPVYEGDVEETKETQKRIKKDQLNANIFDMKDEGSYDEEEREEARERALRDKFGKGAKKLLIKQENNRLYASDSDETDSEEEQDPDTKKTDAENADAEKQKLASGLSSKGTNTPSGRKEKHQNKSSQDQSEASGNESSRRKHKKNGLTSNLGSGMNTPNGATPRSLSPGPNAGGLKPPLKKLGSSRPNDLKRSRTAGAGSGSDGEGAGSGGEMSDGSRKRMKLKGSGPGSQNVSPGGSRAASPSRDTAAQAPKPPMTLPTIEQLKTSIPENGLTMKEFSEKWKQYTGPENKDRFMKLMKSAVKLVKREGKSWVVPAS